MIRPAALSYAPTFTEASRAAEKARPLHKRWGDADLQRLREACAEFESLLIGQMMRQMRKTVEKSGLIDGGKGERVFTEMMDDEISKQMALRQGIGLKEALIEQLTGERHGATLPQQSAVRSYEKHHAGSSHAALPELSLSGVISSAYGWRMDPFTGEREFHHGIDVASPFGTTIPAAEAGTVVFSGWKSGYGQVVEIEHSKGISTLYAHNASNLVKTGDKVAKYQPIALVGNSGRSTGPHLHFEVREDGRAIDPSAFLRRDPERRYARLFDSSLSASMP